MSVQPRLEDQRPPWQEELRPRVEAEVQKLLSGLKGILSDPRTMPEVASAQAAELAQTARLDFAKHCLVLAPKWLHERGLWPAKTISDWVESDLQAALKHLPPPQLAAPESVLELPLRSWVLAAGVGAFVGMLAGAPLSWLMLGQREAGLAVGGIFGAVAFVGLIGQLSQVPSIRQHLSNILAASAGLSLFVGLWNFYRHGTKGLLGTALGLGATALLLFFTKPQARLIFQEAQWKISLENDFRGIADLILAWCWAHPDRLPSNADKASIKKGLPSSIADTLAELYTDLTAGRSAEDLRDLVELLFTKFAQEGYEWKTVQPGTPFQESFHELYEVLGRLDTSNKVRTRRAALIVDGQVERRGELRRVD